MLAKISIGAVFAEAWVMFRRRFASILVLALVQNLWAALVLVRAFLPPPWMETTAVTLLLIGAGGIVFLVASLAILLLAEGGRRFSIGRLAGRFVPAFLATFLCVGLLALPSYAVLAIADHLGAVDTIETTTAAALFLLLVLIVVSSYLLVTLPACVLEGLGPLKSIGRSIALGKGQRWHLIAILMILAVWFLGIDFIGTRLARALSLQFGFPLDYALLPAIFLALFLFFMPLSLVIGAAHRQMLRARAGVGVDELALVFE